MLEASVGRADAASQLRRCWGLAVTFFCALAERRIGGSHGVAMKSGIARAAGLPGPLVAGLLALSCGTDSTAPRLTALRAALSSADPTTSFNLIGPNTARNPSSGDIIRTTGSGSFDAAAGTIVASGSFTHTTASGTLVARGTWAATAFTKFMGFGGPNPGVQGGQLKFNATLFPDGGTPHTGVPVSVTCLVNAPTGFTEGTTVDAFTEKTGGKTLFHLD